MTTSRAIGIAARTTHLVAVALVVGGAFAVQGFHRPLWVALVIASGLVLLGTEVVHGARHWAYQGRGLTTLLHMAVLLVIPFAPRLTPAVLLASLAIGSAGSHLPRTARKWSLLHRRILE